MPIVPPALTARLDALLASGERRILGIAGAPGSGKSTLAAGIAAYCGERCVVVPMDGFHLAQVELERLGRAGRKGAPDTFDAAGFISLLRRIRHQGIETIYAPVFRREIEEPVAGAIPVDPGISLVVTEGNYLLLDGPWAGVRDLLDETWFVGTEEARRVAWLLARHMSYGRGQEAAAAWIEQTDAPNARLVLETRHRADFVVEQ